MRHVLLGAVVFGFACASSWDQGWTRPGADAETLEHERRACMQDAARGKDVGGFGYDQPDQRLFESCMQSRGWQRRASD